MNVCVGDGQDGHIRLSYLVCVCGMDRAVIPSMCVWDGQGCYT